MSLLQRQLQAKSIGFDPIGDPPTKKKSSKKENTLAYLRSLELDYPKKFDEYGILDSEKNKTKVPYIKMNKDFKKGYINVPSAGRFNFGDMDPAEVPAEFGETYPIMMYKGKPIVATDDDEWTEYMNNHWRLSKTDRHGNMSGEYFPDYRDLKTLEYEKAYGSNYNEQEMKSGGEAKHFLVNNSQENSVSLNNTSSMNKQLPKAQQGMEAQGNQVVQQLQEAISQGATAQDLIPQVLQMTKGDTNMAMDILVKAGFSKDQVSAELDQIANQMDQTEVNQSQEGRPTPEGMPTPEGGQAQAEPSPESGMPPMNMGGTAKEREMQNPFMQMMMQGGKQDFDSIRKQMIKEYRNGGTTKGEMDTSSTEAFVEDTKKRLTSKMFAGYAINKVGNDFQQMRDAAVQSMKYGGTALRKAQDGIITNEFGRPQWDGETILPFMKDQFGIETMDQFNNLSDDERLKVSEASDQYAFYGSDFGEAVMAGGKSYEDLANFSDSDYKNFTDQSAKIGARKEAFAADPNLEKKLKAYGKTYDEYLADPGIKKEVDETTVGSGTTYTDRIKQTAGYQGTEEQQKVEEEQQKQVQATNNNQTEEQEFNNQQTSLSGDFNMSTAQFLTRPLTDIVQGVAGVKQAFGEKEATDQIQFKGFGDMKNMTKEEMAEAIKSGAVRTAGVEDMYRKKDMRKLSRGRKKDWLGRDINPYGKRVFFDSTPVDTANNVEPNPDVNVDPNNPAQVEQANANATPQDNAQASTVQAEQPGTGKETPELARMRDMADQGMNQRQIKRNMNNPYYGKSAEEIMTIAGDDPKAQKQALNYIQKNEIAVPQFGDKGYQGYEPEAPSYGNEIDAQYDTALSNLKSQGIENPTTDQLNSAIDMVEQARGISGVAPGEMQPENWMQDYDKYVQKLGGLSPAQLFQMALGGLIISENQLKYDRPFMPFMEQGGAIPQGYHQMPDGSIMADSAHYKQGGVGGYKNEGYVDFEPIYQSEVDYAQIADGIFQAGSGVNEMLENINRYITPEKRAANRNVNNIFNTKNRGSAIEGKYDPQTGQLMAQDTGAGVYAGQRGDRAVSIDNGITGEFAAKYGLEVGQEVTLSQNELRALKSAGYILIPKK